MHTHFDAQVFWDGALTPSPLHGVTTALAGNCGFTIAPLSDDPADGDYLMRMLARVEGMPLESLRDGVPWNWKTTAEYFDAIDGHARHQRRVHGRPLRHPPRRDGRRGRPSARPTPDELDGDEARCCAPGSRPAALGFSSSWARTHNDAEGHMVPSRYASHDELVELCRVAGEYEGTSLEFIPQVGPKFEPWAVELMTDMSVAAQRPLNWNVMTRQRQATSTSAWASSRPATTPRAKGGKVVALTMPMSFGVRLSFRSGLRARRHARLGGR